MGFFDFFRGQPSKLNSKLLKEIDSLVKARNKMKDAKKRNLLTSCIELCNYLKEKSESESSRSLDRNTRRNMLKLLSILERANIDLFRNRDKTLTSSLFGLIRALEKNRIIRVIADNLIIVSQRVRLLLNEYN